MLVFNLDILKTKNSFDNYIKLCYFSEVKRINSYQEMVEGRTLRSPATYNVIKHYVGANSRGIDIPRDKLKIIPFIFGGVFLL